MNDTKSQNVRRNDDARSTRGGFEGAEQTAPETERDSIRAAVIDGPCESGGVLAALRRSPLVGANLDLSRLRVEGRKG
jgi:hypothetical protein